MVFCQDNSQFFQIFLGRDAFYSFEGALHDGAVGKSAVLCDGIVSPFGMNSHDAFGLFDAQLGYPFGVFQSALV